MTLSVKSQVIIMPGVLPASANESYYTSPALVVVLAVQAMRKALLIFYKIITLVKLRVKLWFVS